MPRVQGREREERERERDNSEYVSCIYSWGRNYCISNESTKVHNPRRTQLTVEIWPTSRFGSKVHVACYVERYPR